MPRGNWYEQEGVDHENRALLAELNDKVPTGKRLGVVAVEDELEIRFLDAPGEFGKSPACGDSPPPEVSRYHAAGKAVLSPIFQTRFGKLVSALLLLQGR